MGVTPEGKTYKPFIVMYKPYPLSDGRVLWERVDTELRHFMLSNRCRELNETFADPRQIRERGSQWTAFVYPHKWYRLFFRRTINIWE